MVRDFWSRGNSIRRKGLKALVDSSSCFTEAAFEASFKSDIILSGVQLLKAMIVAGHWWFPQRVA